MIAIKQRKSWNRNHWSVSPFSAPGTYKSHAGTDWQQFGSVTLETPTAYKNTMPVGFHTFELGKLSEPHTFTLRNETAFPRFHPVSKNHPKHVVRAAFFYYFLVDYTAEAPRIEEQGIHRVSRQVVWNTAIQKLDFSNNAAWIYQRSQAERWSESTFAWAGVGRKPNFSKSTKPLKNAEVQEIQMSKDACGRQRELRIFLRHGWRITDSIDLEFPTIQHGNTKPALRLIHD